MTVTGCNYGVHPFRFAGGLGDGQHVHECADCGAFVHTPRRHSLLRVRRFCPPCPHTHTGRTTMNEHTCCACFTHNDLPCCNPGHQPDPTGAIAVKAAWERSPLLRSVKANLTQPATSEGDPA